MTTTTERDPKTGHRVRRRTLGLAESPERALMGKAYENYATAQRLHVAAHNDLRRALRVAGYRGRPLHDLGDFAKDKGVRDALKVATQASLYLQDAKGQYRKARRAAELVGRAA